MGRRPPTSPLRLASGPQPLPALAPGVSGSFLWPLGRAGVLTWQAHAQAQNKHLLCPHPGPGQPWGSWQPSLSQTVPEAPVLRTVGGHVLPMSVTNSLARLGGLQESPQKQARGRWTPRTPVRALAAPLPLLRPARSPAPPESLAALRRCPPPHAHGGSTRHSRGGGSSGGPCTQLPQSPVSPASLHECSVTPGGWGQALTRPCWRPGSQRDVQ